MLRDLSNDAKIDEDLRLLLSSIENRYLILESSSVHLITCNINLHFISNTRFSKCGKEEEEDIMAMR